MRGGFVLATAIAVVALSGCGGSRNGNNSLVSDIFAEKVKKLASRDLKDPDSAQFRNETLQRKPIAIGAAWKTAVVCGEISGRNSYGAYSGFRRFIVEPGSGQRRLEPAQPDTRPFEPEAMPALHDQAFEADWSAACGGSAPPEPIKSP